MVKGSGNYGLASGTQGQSGVFAFHRCTWASTMVRFPAGCGRAPCASVASAAPAASVVPNVRRVIMMGPPCWRLFDHLVGAQQNGCRQRDAHRLRSLQIDHELELNDLLE